MKKNLFITLAIFSIGLLLFASCKKKDYITGGVNEDVNKYKNITTYDVLKSSPLYDTLVQLIDAAGLKDKINEQGTTFFAPSDYSIYSYLNRRTLYVQQNINQDNQFGLDSLIYYLQNNINGTKDSMLLYLVHTSLPFSVLTNTGSLYPTELAGDTAVVSYEYTKDPNLGYNPVVSGQPQVVYFTQLWYHYDLNDANPAGNITPDIGIRTLCTTSGLITQNGIMNSLENSHVLFFYDTKQ